MFSCWTCCPLLVAVPACFACCRGSCDRSLKPPPPHFASTVPLFSEMSPRRSNRRGLYLDTVSALCTPLSPAFRTTLQKKRFNKYKIGKLP